MLSQIQLFIIFLCYLQSSVLGNQLPCPTLYPYWSLANGDSYGDNIIQSVSSADVLAMRPSLASIVPDSSIFIDMYKFYLVEGKYHAVFTISLSGNSIALYGVVATSNFVDFTLIRCGQSTQSENAPAEAENYAGLANGWSYDCSNVNVSTVLESYPFNGIPQCVAHQEINDVAYIIEEEFTCPSKDNCTTSFYFAAVNVSNPNGPAMLSLSNASSLQDAKTQAYDFMQYPPQMSQWKGPDSPNGKCIRRKVTSESLIDYCAPQQPSWGYQLLPGYELQLVQYQKKQIKSSDHILAIYSVVNMESWNFIFFDLKINSSTHSGTYEINGCGELKVPEEAESDMQQYFLYANGWMPDCSTLDAGEDAYARGQLPSEKLTCVEFQTVGYSTDLLVYNYSTQQTTMYFAIALYASYNYYIEYTSYTGEDLAYAENYLYMFAWEMDY